MAYIQAKIKVKGQLVQKILAEVETNNKHTPQTQYNNIIIIIISSPFS